MNPKSKAVFLLSESSYDVIYGAAERRAQNAQKSSDRFSRANRGRSIPM